MTHLKYTLFVGLLCSNLTTLAEEVKKEAYFLTAETTYARPTEKSAKPQVQNSEVIIKNESSWVNIPYEGKVSSGEKPLQILTRVTKANRETADVEYIAMRPTQNELPVVSTGRIKVRWNEPAQLHETTADKDFSFKVLLKKTELPKN